MAKEKKSETIVEEVLVKETVVEETVVEVKEEVVVSEPKWDGVTCGNYTSLKYKK